MPSKYAKDRGYDAKDLEQIFEATRSRAAGTIDVDRDWLLGILEQALHFEGQTRRRPAWIHPFATRGTPLQP